VPIEYIIGIRNLIRGIEGEVQSFKLGRIWYSATPEQKVALLQEFPQHFTEFDLEDQRMAKAAKTNYKFRMWLRRHPILHKTMIGILMISAPYLFISKTQRWIMSVGQYKAEDAPMP
jgi:hypothetical protein